MRRIALVVLFIGLNFPVIAALKGTTEGAFEVSPTGAATYSIPINIVPGISGMQPKLSINYSSQGGVGNLGVGFSLSGLSQIARCPAIIDVEGYTGAVNVDESDAFCLDGQKLIAIDPDYITAQLAQEGKGEIYAKGSCKDGETSTHYSTEIESFSRIISCGTQGRGPKYFQVWTKSGLIMEYGYSADARLHLRHDDNTVISWAQSKVYDVKGNYYEIGYRNIQFTAPTDANNLAIGPPEAQFYPQYIRYTGNDQAAAALSPARVVHFVYQPRNIEPARHINGTRIYAGGILSSIDSYANATVSSTNGGVDVATVTGKMVRQYLFEYKYYDDNGVTRRGSKSTGHDLLVSITECGFKTNKQCLEPTSLEWTDRQIMFDSATSTGYSDGAHEQIADINGDGASDLVYYKGTCCFPRTGAMYILLGKGDESKGGFQNRVTSAKFPVSAVSNNLAIMKTMDYDGDGDMDLIFPNCHDGYLGQWSCELMPGVANNYLVAKFNGTDFDFVDTGFPALIDSDIANTGDYREFFRPYYIADFDGDGLEDIMYSVRNQKKILGQNNLRYLWFLKFIKNNHSTSDQGKFSDANHPLDSNGDLIESQAAGSVGDVKEIAFLHDLNGDGRMDIVVDHKDSASCKIHYSTSKPNDAYFTFAAKSAPGVLCSSNSKLGLDLRWLDINGDGLLDFVRASYNSDLNVTNVDVYINTGDGFHKSTKIFTENTGTEVGQYEVYSPHAIYQNFKYSYALDYNADGRADLLLPNVEGNWTIYRAETIPADGNPFYFRRVLDSAPDEWLAFSLIEDTPGPVSESGIEPRLALGKTGIPHGNDEPRYILDINGDGKPDMVRTTGGDNSVYQSIINISEEGADLPDISQPYDMIAKITTGLGAEYRVKYSPLTDQWNLGSINDSLDDTGTYEKLNTSSEKEGEYDFIAPMYVVSNVESDMGGTDDAILYRYKGGKLNTHGRGFLGFAETEAVHYFTDSSENKHQKQRIVSIYEQQFPLTGQQYQSYIYSHTNTQIMFDTKYWVSTTFQVRTAPGENDSYPYQTYFPYLSSSHQTGYREITPNSIVKQLSITQNFIDINGDGTPYDRFGNLERMWELRQGDVAGESPQDYYLANSEFADGYFTSTENHYDNITDAGKWQLGRLKDSEVRKTGTYPLAPTYTRLASFSYRDDGMLECETVQPSNLQGGAYPENALTTCYGYDDYGHKTTVTTTGFDGGYNTDGNPLAPNSTVERTSTTNMFANSTSPNGETYQVTTANAYNHVQTDTIDAHIGQVKESTGPNGLTTSYQYDEVGRVIRETLPDESYTVTEYLDCSQLIGETYCTTDTAFVTTSQRFDKLGNSLPKSYSYLDKLLRERRVRSTGFKGEQICSDTAYITTGLHAGRVDYETLPYPCGEDPVVQSKTQYSYFDNGEVQTITSPDGTKVTTQEIKVTRLGKYVRTSTERVRGDPSKNIIHETYVDSAGNLVKSIDHNGEAVRYIRDGHGNVLRTEHYDATGAIIGNETIIATYDITGNRLTLDDPDMGHWEYRYNAFGELKWQKDNKGQIKEIRYDDLGRVEEKTEPNPRTGSDITYRWEYDEGNKAKGKLTRACTLSAGIDCIGETFNRDLFTYDDLGRPADITRTIEGRSYTTSSSYDLFSRDLVSTYPAASENGSNTLQVKNVYNIHGYLEKVTTADDSKTYWKVNTTNIFGNITNETLGNNLTTARTFHPERQTIASITTGTTGQFQYLEYSFDSVGNLIQRIDHKQKYEQAVGVTEDFTYDYLNRLKTVTINSEQSPYLDMVYYPNGNIKTKTLDGVTSHYTYGENGAGPHAVTTISSAARTLGGGGTVNSGDANADNIIDGHDVDLVADLMLQRRLAPPSGKPDCDPDVITDSKDIHCITGKATTEGSDLTDKRYVYDENGHMIRANGKYIKYTASGKPYEIKSRDARLEFIYDANNSRMIQRAISKDGIRTTHYVSGLFKRILDTKGNIKYENYIYAGGRLVSIESYDQDGVMTRNYVHTDHQGSIDVLTSEDIGSGVSIVARYSYDPFGKRRAAEWENGNAKFIDDAIANLSPVGDHGYTGHEMLDNVGLIHMNGRVYDPEIGRFLSADPFIQAPDNLQSFNRYSYVHNNPLSYTDPSGYFLKKLLTEISRGMDRHGRTIAVMGIAWGIGAAAYGLPGATGALEGGLLSGALAAAEGGAISGLLMGSFATGVSLGLISGADHRGVLAAGFTGLATSYAGTLSGLDGISAGLLKGAIGGVSSAMSGGDFFIGFMGSVATAGLAPVVDEMGKVAGFVVSAAIGGTISEAGGGKFANGAITGAFNFMLSSQGQEADEAGTADYDPIVSDPFAFGPEGEQLAAKTGGSCNGSLNACSGFGGAGGSSIGSGSKVVRGDGGALNQATRTALEGGKHAGQLKQFLKQSPKQLRKSIKSFDNQISKHEGWIKDPTSKIKNFNSLRPQQQQNLIHHWRQDVLRHQQLKAIAKDVLKGL